MNEQAKTFFSILAVATFGGFVNFIRSEEKFSISKLSAILCIAAFAGLLAFYLTSALGLSSEFQCAISGIAGYSGGSFLDDVTGKIRTIFLHKISNRAAL